MYLIVQYLKISEYNFSRIKIYNIAILWNYSGFFGFQAPITSQIVPIKYNAKIELKQVKIE